MAAWLLALLGGNLFWLSRPAALRAELDRLLQAELNVPVRYQSLDGNAFGGIVLRGFEVDHPLTGTSWFAVQSLSLKPDWWGLLTQKRPFRVIEVRGLRLVLPFDDQGALLQVSPWRVKAAAQKPGPAVAIESPQRPPSAAWQLPRIDLFGIEIVLENPPPDLAGFQRFGSQDLSLSLWPELSDEDASLALLLPRLALPFGHVKAHGRLRQSGFDLEFESELDLGSEALRASLPLAWKRHLQPIECAGRLRLLAEVHATESARALEWKLVGSLRDVACRMHPFDLPLEDFQATFSLLPEGWQASNARGFFAGQAFQLRAEASPKRFFDTARLSVEIPELRIEDDLLGRIDPERNPNLPPKMGVVRRELDRFEARGKAAVSLDLRADSAQPAGYSLSGALRPLGMRFRYRGDLRPDGTRENAFDYLVQNVQGRILFDPGCILLEDIHAENGDSVVRAYGTAKIEDPVDETYGIVIEAERVPVDARLIAALPPRLQAVVSDLDPKGAIDARITVSRVLGEPLAQPALIAVALDGLSLRPKSFPLALEDCRGTVRGGDGVLRFENLVARLGAARAELSGTMGTSARDFSVALRGSARTIALDEGFLAAVAAADPKLAEQLEESALNGQVDSLDLSIDRPRVGGPLEIRGQLAAERVSIAPKAFAGKVLPLSLRLEVAPAKGGHVFQAVEGSSAAFEGVHANLRGSWQPGLSLDLHAEFPSQELPERFFEEAGPLFLPELSEYRLGGRLAAGTIDWRRLGEAAPTLALALNLRNFEILRRGGPEVGLQGVRADLSFDGREVFASEVFAAIKAQDEPLAFEQPPFFSAARLRLGREQPLEAERVQLGPLRPSRELFESLGLLSPEASLPPLFGEFQISAEALQLPQKGFGPRIQNGRIEGRRLRYGEGAEAFIESLTIEGADAKALPLSEWRLAGELRGRGARVLAIEVPSFECRLRVSREALWLLDLQAAILKEILPPPPGHLTPRTELLDRVLATGEVDLQAATDWTDEELRRFILARESTALRSATREELVRLSLVRGLLSRRAAELATAEDLRALLRAQGHVVPGGFVAPPSHVLIDFDQAAYEAEIHCDPVDAASLGRALSLESKMSGRLRGFVAIQGSLLDWKTMRGQGAISATVKDLIEVPIALEVLEALDVAAHADESPWMRIATRFAIADQCCTFGTATLEARGFRLGLVAPARIQFDGVVQAEVRLSHIGRTPVLAPLIGLLPEALGDRVRLSGTLPDLEISQGN